MGVVYDECVARGSQEMGGEQAALQIEQPDRKWKGGGLLYPLGLKGTYAGESNYPAVDPTDRIL